MGLCISHDAFDGAYSAFNRFRKFIANCVGGSYPPHENKELFSENDSWYWGKDSYSEFTHPGLYEFFCHSDCDGYIEPDMCLKIAAEMRELKSIAIKLENEMGNGGGHIARDGGYVAVIDRFIAGCELAGSKGERLEFG